MGKRNRNRQEHATTQVLSGEPEAPNVVAVGIQPRAFIPRNCTLCTQIRIELKLDQSANYSDVYCTRGSVRYCKCRVCGNTWSQEKSA